MESAHRCGQDEGGSRPCPSKEEEEEEEESWSGVRHARSWEPGKRLRTPEETGGLYEGFEAAAFTPTTTRLDEIDFFII